MKFFFSRNMNCLQMWQDTLSIFLSCSTVPVFVCLLFRHAPDQHRSSLFLIWSKPGWKPPSLPVDVNRSFSKTLAPASALRLLQARASFTASSLFFLKQKIRRRLHCTCRVASLTSASFIVYCYREHNKQCKSHTRVFSEFHIMTNVKNSTEIFS
jgi:hypothetical protein